MKKYLIHIFMLSALVCNSCKDPHTKESYMPLLKELHTIECDQFKKAGIVFEVNDTNIYTYKGIAFDRIMTKDPDAKLIARYEDLNQKLAAMEFFMDENEKQEFKNDIKIEYLKQCN